MTNQDYEKAKRECWDDYTRKCAHEGKSAYGAFCFAFDRAYALGKLQASCGQVKETITQEDIEKAAIDYIRTNPFVNSRTATTARESFVDGVNFTLGKQEKDAEDTVISGWVARDENNSLYLYEKRPVRDHNEWIEETVIYLDDDLFPDLTWESDPLPIEIIIKQKNNG